MNESKISTAVTPQTAIVNRLMEIVKLCDGRNDAMTPKAIRLHAIEAIRAVDMITPESSVPAVNPESMVLNQLEGHWQKMAMLVLWKLAKKQKVRVMMEDIEALMKTYEPGIPHLLTHGHANCFDFQIVDEAKAKEIAEYDARMRGQGGN